MTWTRLVDSTEIEFGRWLNDDPVEISPIFLPPYLRELYDAAKDSDQKFIAILTTLGKEKVGYAMQIANEAKKIDLLNNRKEPFN